MATNGKVTQLSAELTRLRQERRVAQLAVELNALRRERDWTFTQLTEAIEAVTHHRRDEDCWRRICQGKTDKPQERTLHILTEFLASVRAPKKVRRRRVA